MSSAKSSHGIADRLDRYTSKLEEAGVSNKPTVTDETTFLSQLAAYLAPETSKRNRSIIERLKKGLKGPAILSGALVYLEPGLQPPSLTWNLGLALFEAAGMSRETTGLALTVFEDINRAVPDIVSETPTQELHRAEFVDLVLEVLDQYFEFCLFGVRQLRSSCTGASATDDLEKRLERELSRCKTRMESVCSSWANYCNKELAIQQAHHSRNRNSRDQGPRRTQQKSKRHFIHTLTPKSQQFVHRETELNKIHQILALTDSTTAADIKQCILHGIAGVGKSETALAYAYRYMDEYDAIFWVDAEENINRVKTYTNIGKKLQIIAPDRVGGADDIDKVREELEKTDQRWLIIFDNVVTYSDVSLLIPSLVSEHGAILYTTQLSNLRATVQEVLIQPLSTTDGADLILQQVRNGVNNELPEKRLREYAEQISEIYDGFPLVLNMACGYIKTGEINLADFCEEFRRSSQPWKLGPESQPQSHPNADARFDVALANLPDNAEQLIRILAFMNPDAIPEDLIGQKFTDPCLSFLTGNDTRFFMDMAVVLGSRNLVKRQTTSSRSRYFQMHRYLQHQVLKRISAGKCRDSLQLAFNQAVAIIRQATPNASPIQVPTPDLWLQFEKVLPHLINLERQASSFAIDGTLEYARLLSDAGMNMWERGMSMEALKLLEASEKALSDTAASEDLLRANIHVIIVLLLWDFGISRREETRTRISTAVDIRREYCNRTRREDYTHNDDILLHNALSDLAVTHLQFHDIESADPIFDQCFLKYQSWDTEEKIPYEYAKYYHHKAFCYLYHEQFEDALRHGWKGWKLMQRATDPQSSLAYRFQFDYACILLQSGYTDKALKHHMDILEGRKRHGQYGALTLQSYYAIGALKAHCKDYAAAIEYIRLALDGARRAGWMRVAKARAEYHLGFLLKLRDMDDAEASSLLASAEEVLLLFKDKNQDAPVPQAEKLVLLDHMQPVFDARFAGVGLLPFVTRKRPQVQKLVKEEDDG